MAGNENYGHDKYTVEATCKFVITDEDITDLIVDGLECGIGYWSCLDNTGPEFTSAPKDEPVSETAAKIIIGGGELKLLDDECRSTVYHLTLDKLLGGIVQYIESGMDYYGVFSNGEMDMGRGDAECCDCIIQLALFGELVYA